MPTVIRRTSHISNPYYSTLTRRRSVDVQSDWDNPKHTYTRSITATVILLGKLPAPSLPTTLLDMKRNMKEDAEQEKIQNEKQKTDTSETESVSYVR